MKFHLVDKIEAFEPGRRIVTIKALSLAEEYLADHFPAFPVLPGVMMLEALAQAGGWLVRDHQGFARSVVVLASARNVRYGSFVAPGNTLRCDVEAVSLDEEISKFKGSARVGDRQAVSARFELRSFNLVDRAKHLADADRRIVEQCRRTFTLIGGPAAASSEQAG